MKIKPSQPMTARPLKGFHRARTWMERWPGRTLITLLCAGGLTLLVVSFFTDVLLVKVLAGLALVAGVIYTFLGDRIRARFDRAMDIRHSEALIPVRVREKRVSTAIHMNSDGSVRSTVETYTLAFEHLDSGDSYEYEVRQVQFDSAEEDETGLLHLRDGQYVGFEKV